MGLPDARHAFKLKKPVHLPFVDYRTLERRRQSSENELRLGRRLAANVYGAVVPLVATPSGLAIGGEGEATDWLVVMRRLARDSMLPEMLEHGEATASTPTPSGISSRASTAPRSAPRGPPAESRRRLRTQVSVTVMSSSSEAPREPAWTRSFATSESLAVHLRCRARCDPPARDATSAHFGGTLRMHLPPSVGRGIAANRHMSFTRILCPTDFSAGAQQAQRMAVQIAAKTGADLVIVHAWRVPAIAFANEELAASFMREDAMVDAQRELDAAVEEANAQLAKPATGVMRRGVPWTEIVSLLDEEAFDLCVIGTHGRTGLARVLVGSVAENVVRHAPCSVLVVRPDNVVKPFQHVLVPTDFSASATYALDLAESLVEPEGRITLLHMLEVAGPYPGRVSESDVAYLDHRAGTALRELAATKKNARVAGVWRVGWPGVQILAALDEDRSIDLVAMGSHGRTGIKRALIGSVAEKTVRYAHCPVLVSRQRIDGGAP